MHSALDTYLGIHPQALALEAQRTDVLAANLANVDTPNYKARDVDFKAAMAAVANEQQGALPGSAPSAAPLTLATTDAEGLSSAGTTAGSPSASAGTEEAGPYLKYRTPLAPSLDGNTVDGQLEEAAFAENSVRYQATLTLLTVKLKDLLTAVGS